MRGGLTAFLGAVLLGGGTASAVTVVDAAQKIRPAESITGSSTAVLRAARNEFAPFQIVVEGGGSGRNSVTATASALVGPSGTIPATEVRLYRLGYLNLTTPSNDEGGTGLWPDPLIPDVDEVAGEKRNAFPFDVRAWENRIIFVDLHVPRSALPGVYTGTVTVNSAGLSEVVPITLRVLDFEVPATSSMPTTYGINWSAACVAHYGSLEACGADAGIIRMNTMYARYMLDHRITGEVVYIAPSWSGSGYDWANTFDPYYAPLLDGTAGDVLLDGAQVTSLRYRGPREVSRYADWANHFRGRGWFTRTYDYTCDEPPITCEWYDIPVRASLVRQGDPDLRTLVTTNIDDAVSHAVDDDIDILVPVVNHMHDRPGASRFEGNQRARYDAFLQLGPRKELWWYQCCMSHGCGYIGGSETSGWPSYMIDATGVQNRAMQWLTFSYGIRGELYYEALLRLPDAWTSVFDFGGNGDGTLLYPGTPAAIGGTTHVPVASYRLKMIREGMEDYEYLQRLVELGDPSFAHAVARALFPTVYETRQPVAKLREARDLVIDRIVELTTPRLWAWAARGPIVIDGNLAEFAGAPAVGLSGAEVGSDSTAQVRALWDEDRLYVAWDVKDATQRINQGGPDGEVWNGDGVEVMLDAAANGTAAPDADDYHVGINVQGDVRDEQGGGSPWDATWSSGVQRAVTTTALGYTVEVSIPWSALGIASAGGGLELGFDVAVNDSDSAGEVKAFDWIGLSVFAQPMRWGRLTLAAASPRAELPGSGMVRVVDSTSPQPPQSTAGCTMAPQRAGIGAIAVLLGLAFIAARRRSRDRR
jgi:hypothetical protein